MTAAAPTGVQAVGVSANAITVSWLPSTDPTVTGYDVFARTYVKGIGGKGTHVGHYVYATVGVNLTTTSDTITGLAPGTFHTYLVKAVAPSGLSPYSAAVTAETWVGPTLPSGDTYLTSSGAVMSGPVSVTAGNTVQIKSLAAGNPLNFSLVGSTAGASIDANTGVLTYTPGTTVSGIVPITIQVSNALGSVNQTINFSVTAANPALLKPQIKLSATTSVFSGYGQTASGQVVGVDGLTPVAGTLTFAYNGGPGTMLNAGTYTLLATFTSADPAYASTTLLTNYVVKKATPTLSSLSSPTIAVGQSTATVTGHVSTIGTYPAGEYVAVTLNGVTQNAVVDTAGNFTSSFSATSLALGSYAVSYAYAGDSNLNARTGSSVLKVIGAAAPKVTTNPADSQVTVTDPVTFTAAATGSPVPTVQWQVSIDGGLTFTNITGNASATTTTLSLGAAYLGLSGNKYRAVFTNSVGQVITTVATLTVDPDTGGGL
jgi:hypothetical protein